MRPWGSYERLTEGGTTTVKVITVSPGHRLSLQRHEEREEHWLVLDVPMDVHVDGVDRVAHPGERVVVPRGAVHRLGNSGSVAGRVLEIAYGRFDEDDIERLADDYGR